MKKQLLLLIAACLLSSSGFACEEGRPQAVRLLSDEAQQIHVFTKHWQIIHPLDGAPLQEFAVTDLDGNGLLEILSRTPADKGAPLVYEVTPAREGLQPKSKQWYYRHALRQHIAWFTMHPETAAAPWLGRTDTVEMMLQDSYDIYAGRKEAFG